MAGEVTRPVLRWHGGKWMLAPWIIEHLPPHRIYVEPFGGAASVLLRKPRSYAEVYNDLDRDVVVLFRILRNEERAAELVRQLRNTPFAREEFKDAYEVPYKAMDRARSLVIRSFMGFGSNGHARPTGFRSNSNRSGTTPARDWMNYPDALEAIVERLRGVVIENNTAAAIISDHDTPETLFYVDPPYVPATRDKGADYRHEMSDSDHVALLERLQSVEGMVVLSGYPHPLYDEALSGWRRVERDALADGARPRTEVLWINPRAARSLAANAHPDLFGAAA